MDGPKWYDNLPRWARQTIDQAAHVAMGLAAASVLWIPHPVAAGLAASVLLAAAREREQWPPKRIWDLVLDVAMVSVGGLIMGLIVWGVTR